LWPAPLHAKEEGRIFPFTVEILRKRLAALREKQKIRTIKHGARHSFASYWLAIHGDIDKLCRFLGHDDPETTFRHYAKAATTREAKKFFAIQPKLAKSRKVIAFPGKSVAA
jgi:integrase